jgi:hypothetical protein
MERAAKEVARNRLWQRKYLALARKTVALAGEEKLNFDLDWLKSLTGVVAWVEREGHITDAQIRAIVNATRAVRKIVKFKKLKEGRTT